jgi:hypothetical protein
MFRERGSRENIKVSKGQQERLRRAGQYATTSEEAKVCEDRKTCWKSG